MSQRYIGGIVSKTPPTTSGGKTGSASGVWTIDQAMQKVSASAWPLPKTVPDAPTIGTATPGNQQVSVAFTAPADDGGSTITQYTATSSPGSFTGTAGSSPVTVTGLTNGTAYTFTVTATNAIGTSAPSASSNSATPVQPTYPGGNQSYGSLQLMGSDIANNYYDQTGPSAGGTLTINSVSLGSYDFTVKNGNQTVSSFTTGDWFTTTKDTRSAIIVVNGNLTINSGQTFIPSVRKLFTMIYVKGNLTVNGSISMSARGSNHNGTGDSGGSTSAGAIRLATGTFSGVSNPEVPAAGGAGGSSTTSSSGNAGSAGTNGGTGGGASGGTNSNGPSGGGAAGTSFSGGAGGGGTESPSGGQAATANGGAGGCGRSANGGYPAGGGAGNLGGYGGNGGNTLCNYNDPTANGQDGTGGVLVIFCTGTFSGSGSVVAAGANGGTGSGANGGGSGGGSITVFYGSDSGPTPSASGGSNGGGGGAGTARKLAL